MLCWFLPYKTKINHNYISSLLSFPPHPRSSQNARGTTEKKEKILSLDGRSVRVTLKEELVGGQIVLWPFLENTISQHSHTTPIPCLNNLSQLSEVIPSLWPSICIGIDRPNPSGAMRFKRALSRVSGKEKQVSS